MSTQINRWFMVAAFCAGFSVGWCLMALYTFVVWKPF